MISDKQICYEWLEIKDKDIRPLTHERYETIINKYLLPFFEENPLSQLDEETISEYLKLQYDNDILSAYMIKIIKVVLNSVCEYAYKEYGYKYIDFNKIKLNIEIEKKPLDILTKEQENLIYQYCLLNIDALSVSILLGLYTGLRLIEILALQMKDIHLEEGFINVSKKYEKHINQKNNKDISYIEDLESFEKRQIVLQPFLINYLRNFITNNNPNYYLLSQSDKVPVKRTYQGKLNLLGKQLDLNINYTIFRNTFKNNCINNDVGIYTLMKSLGISRMEIVLDDTHHQDIHHIRQEILKINPNKGEKL